MKWRNLETPFKMSVKLVPKKDRRITRFISRGTVRYYQDGWRRRLPAFLNRLWRLFGCCTGAGRGKIKGGWGE